MAALPGERPRSAGGGSGGAGAIDGDALAELPRAPVRGRRGRSGQLQAAVAGKRGRSAGGGGASGTSRVRARGGGSAQGAGGPEALSQDHGSDAEVELGAAAVDAWYEPQRSRPRTRGGYISGSGPRTRGGFDDGTEEGAASEGESSSSGAGSDGGARRRKRRHFAPASGSNAGDAADAELAELGEAAAAYDAVRGCDRPPCGFYILSSRQA